MRAALVLAAGSASRFGGSKLEAALNGESLIIHALRTACAAPVERVVIVASQNLDLTGIAGKAGETDITIVRLESAALSDSLRAGLAAVPEAEGVFVFLGDMPLVPPGLAAVLAESLGEAFAAQPVHLGQPGHPVLLSARALPEIARLTGDCGAGKLLHGRSDVVRVEVSDPGICTDIDTREDLSQLQSRGVGKPAGRRE